MQDLIICHILYIDTKLENINPKHHIPNDSDIVPQELIIDIKHVHPNKYVIKSINMELTNAKHHINIINLHKQMIKCKSNQINKLNIEHIMETSC
jgi:hypothetical protein